MTQVQMTDQQLNRALAELMGYYTVTINYEVIALYKNGEKLTGWWTHIEENAWSYAPEYCNDPAASLEVQAKAIKANYIKYVSTLCDILNGESDEMSGELSPESVADMLTASPRERAEAAYITLSSK